MEANESHKHRMRQLRWTGVRLMAEVREDDEDLTILKMMKSEMSDIVAMRETGQISAEEAGARLEVIDLRLDRLAQLEPKKRKGK
jgi:hypothetical protein